MQCPFCGHNDSKVIDSRESVEGIRRRRECFQCERRYTTYERVQTTSLQVVKRDKRREEFNREKLRSSILKACTKRPLPTGSIDKLVEDIEGDLMELGRSEVSSRTIGEIVMARLKSLDRVPYIRYASVYRDFRDIETFREEIDALLEPRGPQAEPVNQLFLLPVDEDEVPVVHRKRRGRRSERLDGGL